MKKTTQLLRVLLAGILAVAMLLTSAGSALALESQGRTVCAPSDQTLYKVTPTETISSVTDNIKTFSYKGDDGLNSFYQNGGASSVNSTLLFLGKNIVKFRSAPDPKLYDACSTIHTQGPNGHWYFGRNFDYSPCNMIIVKNEPTGGYKNITSVDMDFVTEKLGSAAKLIPDDVIKKIALWIPLDGMNEKGVAISINMIQDDAIIDQKVAGKTDQICVTAVRTILDRAASVDEALKILAGSNFHTWEGFMVHLAISDPSGKHVAVEWLNDQMYINDTPIMTNFYITPGEKHGIGTHQSVIRFGTLTDTLAKNPNLSATEVRDALASVAKSNFPDDNHTTEWSIVFDQNDLTATYYRQENYKVGYIFSVK